tara:strand:+ start:262 stop:378 length:117 start_codon:yes stop_codon:yes gene_type:complete
VKEIIKKAEIKNLLKSFEKTVVKELESEKLFKNIKINQ